MKGVAALRVQGAARFGQEASKSNEAEFMQ
jgi:hypothetical protein